MLCEFNVQLFVSHSDIKRLLQISSRDDITVSALVEESRRLATRRWVALGTVRERCKLPEYQVFPFPEGHECRGRRYTAGSMPWAVDCGPGSCPGRTFGSQRSRVELIVRNTMHMYIRHSRVSFIPRRSCVRVTVLPDPGNSECWLAFERHDRGIVIPGALFGDDTRSPMQRPGL